VLLAVALNVTVRCAPLGQSPTNRVAFAVRPKVISGVSDRSETVAAEAFAPVFSSVTEIAPSSPICTSEFVSTTRNSSTDSPGVTPNASGPDRAGSPASS